MVHVPFTDDTDTDRKMSSKYFASGYHWIIGWFFAMMSPVVSFIPRFINKTVGTALPPSQHVAGSECLCELSTPRPRCFVKRGPMAVKTCLVRDSLVTRRAMENHDSSSVNHRNRSFSMNSTLPNVSHQRQHPNFPYLISPCLKTNWAENKLYLVPLLPVLPYWP